MDAHLNIFTTIVCLLHIVTHATPAVKIWKPELDIRGFKYFPGKKYGTDCNGLVLGEKWHSSFILGDMKIKGLSTGFHSIDIYLMDGTTIEFAEDTTDVLNCVQIPGFGRELFSWADSSNWITKGEEGNVAIPHAERIPCAYDELEFPKGWLSGACLISTNVKLRSLKFGDAYLTNDDFKKIKLSTIPILLSISAEDVDITWKTCTDSDECLCNSNLQDTYTCYYKTSMELDASLASPEACSHPVTPIGHCTEICGAVITAKPQHNFNIEFLKHYLKEYTSHTYASKMKNGTEVVVQIVFAEQNFTGISLDEAQEFYYKLIREDIFKLKDVRILSSERLFSQADMTKNVLSIVFGTLCGVVLVFAILFFVYSPQSTFNLRNRFSTRPVTSFRTNFFAKYDPSEQTGLILRTQSPVESVLSLDKSFDNPMYGRSTPSTSSTSYDTVATHEERVVKSEICLENPMYDLNSMGETSQANKKEGELVDLTKKEE